MAVVVRVCCQAKVKLACCTKSDADRKAAQDTIATQSKIRLLPIPVVYSLNMDLHISKHGYYQPHFIQWVQY